MQNWEDYSNPSTDHWLLYSQCVNTSVLTRIIARNKKMRKKRKKRQKKGIKFKGSRIILKCTYNSHWLHLQTQIFTYSWYMRDAATKMETLNFNSIKRIEPIQLLTEILCNFTFLSVSLSLSPFYVLFFVVFFFLQLLTRGLYWFFA
jgi:hypothetical protein